MSSRNDLDLKDKERNNIIFESQRIKQIETDCQSNLLIPDG